MKSRGSDVTQGAAVFESYRSMTVRRVKSLQGSADENQRGVTKSFFYGAAHESVGRVDEESFDVPFSIEELSKQPEARCTCSSMTTWYGSKYQQPQEPGILKRLYQK